MLTFNYDLDVASIFVFIVIILIYCQQNFVKNKSYYAFIWMWFFSILTAVMDIGSVHGLENHSTILFYLSNGLYYLGQQWTAYTFFRFALLPLWRRERVPVSKLWIFSLPILISTIAVVLTPFNGYIYKYDSATGLYSYGPGQWICYFAAIFYYLYAIYFVTMRKDLYNKNMRFAEYNSTIVIAIAVLVQYIDKGMLTHSFAISICLLQLVIVSINSHAVFYPETGMLNGQAFYEKATNLTYNRIPFNVIAMRVVDFELVMATYGKKNIKDLEAIVCREILQITPKNQNYYVCEDMITAIIENQSPEDLEKMKTQLDEVLSKKWSINGLDLGFTYFITSFSSPENFKTVTQLRSLMVYLERTRRKRYGIMEVDEFAIRNLSRESEVEQAIVHALQFNEFEMYYQPIINLKTGKYICSEALIRLNQSAIGPIGPAEFIPISENSGLIVQIGDYVLDAVFKFAASHDLKALGIEYIELNLSTIQCLQRDFISGIEEKMEKYNINPATICFEITETASNCAPEIFIKNLTILHEKGFKLAIDDFGTGYGNLNRLLSMSFDVVKFDKDTTCQLCDDEKVRPMFRKLIRMMHSMNSTIVAEGVETQTQAEFLSSIHTDYIQGFYYAQPMPEYEYIDFLKKHN